MKARYCLPLAVLFALCLSQCSIGFNQQYSQAVAEAAKNPSKDITGPWQGTWLSHGNGHTGQLLCVVTRPDPKSDECRFHYHAVFMSVLSASYEVTHHVKPKGNGFTFSGDQHLSGLGGGLYHYEGTVIDGHFHATYRADIDHGVFDMNRP